MSKTVETEMICPTCEYEIELSSSVDHDEAPHDGAVSICFRCATPAMFAERDDAVGGLYMRPLTPEEWRDIITDRTIAITRAGVVRAHVMERRDRG